MTIPSLPWKHLWPFFMAILHFRWNGILHALKCLHFEENDRNSIWTSLGALNASDCYIVLRAWISVWVKPSSWNMFDILSLLFLGVLCGVRSVSSIEKGELLVHMILSPVKLIRNYIASLIHVDNIKKVFYYLNPMSTFFRATNEQNKQN